jgi:hypothetical protein
LAVGLQAAATYVVSIFLGSPARKPTGADIVAVTNPIKSDFRKSCRAQFEKKDPSIKLNGDGTAILKNVPVFDGFGD